MLPEDPAAIVYTSGTTGLPKGAVLTHRGLLRNCRAAIDGVLGLGADDVGLAVMPMFHVGGMWYHLFPSYASGGTTVMHAEFNAAAVLEAIRVHRVTHVHIVPTMIAALLDQPGVESADLGRLRLIKYAASSIPLAVLKRAQHLGHCAHACGPLHRVRGAFELADAFLSSRFVSTLFFLAVVLTVLVSGFHWLFG